MIDYDVIEQKEIMLELFSENVAKIRKVAKQRGINDRNHPLIIMQNKVNNIRDDILSIKYSTMDDMKQLKGVYMFIKEYIEELQHYE